MEWVPKSKQALANGIAIGGSAVGAVVAPPLCVYLLGIVGWRSVFLISGGFGFIWLLAWLIYTRKEHTLPEAYEKENTENNTKSERVKFAVLLKNKEALVFIVIRFVLDPIFYFYMFWIPKYLNECHLLSLDSIGKILWVPFLALGIANVLGGWLSDFIFIRTSSVNMARKLIMGLAAMLTMPILFTSLIDSYQVILGLISLAFFAHGLWITNYITAISDVFGKQVTSTVVGLSGSAGALSSLVLNPIIGYVIMNYSYSPLWWYAGLMYPFAFLLLLWFIPRIEVKSLSMAVA